MARDQRAQGQPALTGAAAHGIRLGVRGHQGRWRIRAAGGRRVGREQQFPALARYGEQQREDFGQGVQDEYGAWAGCGEAGEG